MAYSFSCCLWYLSMMSISWPVSSFFFVANSPYWALILSSYSNCSFFMSSFYYAIILDSDSISALSVSWWRRVSLISCSSTNFRWSNILILFCISSCFVLFSLIRSFIFVSWSEMDFINCSLSLWSSSFPNFFDLDSDSLSVSMNFWSFSSFIIINDSRLISASALSSLSHSSLRVASFYSLFSDPNLLIILSSCCALCWIVLLRLKYSICCVSCFLRSPFSSSNSDFVFCMIYSFCFSNSLMVFW